MENYDKKANPEAKASKETKTTYSVSKIIGSGSFGVVYKAKLNETGETVAIKKVFQDRRFKNRELTIMKELDHPNVIKLKNYFYTEGDKKGDIYLNVVMDFIPEPLSRVTRQFSKSRSEIPPLQVKLFSYQLVRSLNYLKAKAIGHRDIKPQNVLVNPDTCELKLCDFGSAKRLEKGQPNVAYICSRYYRAPELIFGATEYETSIDMWSVGCVIAEMIMLKPIFPGDSAVDQIIEIIKIKGTPTKEQIFEMSSKNDKLRLPKIKPASLEKIFRKYNVSPEFLDLLDKMLTYEPNKRITPLEALAHPYFDELKQKNCKLPNGNPLPDLFSFTKEEIEASAKACLEIVPEWYSLSQIFVGHLQKIQNGLRKF